MVLEAGQATDNPANRIPVLLRWRVAIDDALQLAGDMVAEEGGHLEAEQAWHDAVCESMLAAVVAELEAVAREGVDVPVFGQEGEELLPLLRLELCISGSIDSGGVSVIHTAELVDEDLRELVIEVWHGGGC